MRASAAASRSASGSTTAWFLAPPSAWARVPDGSGPLEDVAGHRRRPDEGHRGHAGVVDEGVHRHGVAVDHREDPSGSPAFGHRSATSTEGDGSRSEGLRTKALPQAMDTGYIHMGTMTGKLNGVIPATTPSGWRTEEGVDPVGHVLGELALQQVGDPAGELDHLEATGHLARGRPRSPCRARR